VFVKSEDAERAAAMIVVAAAALDAANHPLNLKPIAQLFAEHGVGGVADGSGGAAADSVAGGVKSIDVTMSDAAVSPAAAAAASPLGKRKRAAKEASSPSDAAVAGTRASRRRTKK
jgi:hypothetical protein